MNQFNPTITSRREFLKKSGRLAAASATAVGVVRPGYTAGSDSLNLALVGCGGRGTGAVKNAFAVSGGPIKLVAMADVFENRLKNSYKELSEKHTEDVDVPEDRQFLGFDGYRQAMDCLRPGDIVILATPPAFRWVHFRYAIQKGLNVFMEKPVTVDGPTSRRMFRLAKQAEAKNLKVAVGLMSRHQRAMQQLHERIQDGEIGEIILQRGYRMQGPIGTFASPPKPPNISHLMYQVQRFHSFLWAGGGSVSDFLIHIIDHQCWMKNDWPVKAQAVGGRHYRRDPKGVRYVDQNFDSYAIEYTFADGSKFFMEGRCMEGCAEIYSSAIHGSKGMAIVSKKGDCGMPSSTYKGQNPDKAKLIWESNIDQDESNPYVNEWRDLLDAIRNDKPYNEAERGIRASLVTSMGRMAAHTGQEITYEQMLNCPHEFAPGLDKLTADSPPPLKPDAQGRYPVPQPGIVKDREYADFE